MTKVEICRQKAIQQHELNFSEREQKAINTINAHAPEFEYVGGFTNTDGRVDIRCKACGFVESRSLITIRHKHVECDNCKRIAAEQKEKKRKIEADKKEWAKAGKQEAKQLSFSFCKACGGLFYSERLGVLYCSDSCYKRVMNARAKDKRIKKLSGIIVDKGITLERLFDKSNGVCALCGGKCNWADHFVKDNGAFVAGSTYPSIDHIRPISKGGLHEWKNVQLAHFYCNTIKRNNP